MSYRYNTIDIIVGVGLCAILFGALLLFAAANGTYQVVLPQALASEQPATSDMGMSALQPALGQAILDQALFERRTNHAMAQSVSEWNRATMAHYELYSGSRGLLGTVLNEAATVPATHLARVQGVMGRAIVNVTTRGVRSGFLSADHYGSMYNMTMIGAIEARGQQLHHAFASTWQATLGRRIVEAAQHDWIQAGAIQERLGWALVRVVEAQRSMEQGQATQQEQLAGLIFAAVRSATPTDRISAPAPIALSAKGEMVAVSEPMAWPEIPMGYLVVAGFMLSAVFLGALSLAAQGREARALAQIRRDADRWVYRMAA
ncbi:MAG: hypothetical protein NDI90_05470 [Nitrospira sp. BO4]|jgi:hypothetical protein|nr:hypothetical protein [Nitrospira sp. BO4]